MKEIILVLQQGLKTSSDCISNDFFSWLLEDCIGSENDEVRCLAFQNIVKIYESHCFRWSEVKQALYSEFSSAEAIDDGGIDCFRYAVRVLELLPQMELINFMISKDMLATVKTCCLARHLEVRSISVSKLLPVLLFKVWTVLDTSYLDAEGILSLATASIGSGDKSESESDCKQLKEVLKDSINDFIQILCMHINASRVESYPLSPSDIMNNVACTYSSSTYTTLMQGQSLFQSCCGVLAQLYEHYNYPHAARHPDSVDRYVEGLYVNGIHVGSVLCGTDTTAFSNSCELDGHRSSVDQHSVVFTPFVKVSLGILSVDLGHLMTQCRAGSSSMRFYGQLLLMFACQDFASVEAMWGDGSGHASTDSTNALLSRLTKMKCAQNGGIEVSVALAKAFLNSQQFSSISSPGSTSSGTGFGKARELPLRFFLDQLVGNWCDEVLMPAIACSSLTQRSLSGLAILCRDFIHLTNNAGSLHGSNHRALRGKYGGAIVDSILSSLLHQDELAAGEGREMSSILLAFVLFLLKSDVCRTLGLEQVHASTTDECKAQGTMYHYYMAICECIVALYCSSQCGFNDVVCTRLATELNSVLFQHCIGDPSVGMQIICVSVLSEVLGGDNFIAHCFGSSASDVARRSVAAWGTGGLVMRHKSSGLLQKEFMGRLLPSLCCVSKEYLRGSASHTAMPHVAATALITLTHAHSCLSWPLHGRVTEAPSLTYLDLLEEVCSYAVSADGDGPLSLKAQVRQLLEDLIRRYVDKMATPADPVSGFNSKQAILCICLSYYPKLCATDAGSTGAADILADQVVDIVKFKVMRYDALLPALNTQLMSAHNMGHLGHGSEREADGKILLLPRGDHFVTYMQHLSQYIGIWLSVLLCLSSYSSSRKTICEKLMIEFLHHLRAVQVENLCCVSDSPYFSSILTSISDCYTSLSLHGPLDHVNEFSNVVSYLVTGKDVGSGHADTLAVIVPTSEANATPDTLGHVRVVNIHAADRHADIGTTRSMFSGDCDGDTRVTCTADIYGIIHDILQANVAVKSQAHNGINGSGSNDDPLGAVCRRMFELHRYDSANLNNNCSSIGFSTANGNFSTLINWRCLSGSSDMVNVYFRFDKCLFSSRAVLLVRVYNTSGMKLPSVGVNCSIVCGDGHCTVYGRHFSGSNTSWSNDYVVPNTYVERCFDLDLVSLFDALPLSGVACSDDEVCVQVQVLFPDTQCSTRDEFYPLSSDVKVACSPTSAVLNCDIFALPVLSMLFPYGMGAFCSAQKRSALRINGGIPHFVYGAMKSRLPCSSIDHHFVNTKSAGNNCYPVDVNNVACLVDFAHSEQNPQWQQYMFDSRVNTLGEGLELNDGPTPSMLVYIFHTYHGDEVLVEVSVEPAGSLVATEGYVRVYASDASVVRAVIGGVEDLICSISAGIFAVHK